MKRRDFFLTASATILAGWASRVIAAASAWSIPSTTTRSLWMRTMPSSTSPARISATSAGSTRRVAATSSSGAPESGRTCR